MNNFPLLELRTRQKPMLVATYFQVHQPIFLLYSRTFNVSIGACATKEGQPRFGYLLPNLNNKELM
jgi:hypothetical protein